jgi:hypothetical protein
MRFNTGMLYMLFLTAGLLAAGCLSFGTTQEGNPISESDIQKLIKGKTTKAEVLEILGAPFKIETTEITKLAEQAVARYAGEELTLKIDPALFNDVYIYERKEVNYFFFSLILFSYYASDERHDRLAVFFDKDGKVLGIGWSPGRKGL